MTIETISYLKQNAASLALDEPMVITQSGKPVYRIENEESAKLRDEGIALLKLMNLVICHSRILNPAFLKLMVSMKQTQILCLCV